MTIIDIILIVLLLGSIASALLLVRKSNQKVEDLDGFGGIVKKREQKGKTIMR